MLLHQLFSEYRSTRLLTAKPHTVRKYRYAIGRFERWIGHVPQVIHLSDVTLAEFRFALITDGLARATANSYVQHLVALWNYAWRRGYVSTGPTIKDLPEIHREPVAFDVDQIGRILEATRVAKYDIAGIPANMWWRALFLVLYDTGWRVGAAMSVQWSDVRPGDQTVMVRGENQKSLKDSRKPVSNEAITALLAIQEPRRRLVWPWDRHPGYFWTKAREIFLAANIPDDRRFRMHCFRKTHGTLVAARLGDHAAADSLQHSSVQTFRRHYRDASKIDGQNVLDALPRPKAS